jgi:hypothetical protein
VLLAWDEDVFIDKREQRLLYRFAEFVDKSLPRIEKIGFSEEDREFVLGIYIYYEFL